MRIKSVQLEIRNDKLISYSISNKNLLIPNFQFLIKNYV